MRGMGGMQAPAASNAVVEYKCGRMNYDGRMVTPDRRKGKLKIVKDRDMGVYKLQWFEEGSRDPTDDFMVFPDDTKFEKVKQSNDRVYLFEFKQTG